MSAGPFLSDVFNIHLNCPSKFTGTSWSFVYSEPPWRGNSSLQLSRFGWELGVSQCNIIGAIPATTSPSEIRYSLKSNSEEEIAEGEPENWDPWVEVPIPSLVYDTKRTLINNFLRALPCKVTDKVIVKYIDEERLNFFINQGLIIHLSRNIGQLLGLEDATPLIQGIHFFDI